MRLDKMMQPGRAGSLWRRAWPALLTVCLVAGWRGGVWMARYSSRALADDLASVGVFSGAALPDPACRQLLFARNTEQGMAIYTSDLKTGQQHAVMEIGETRILSGSFRVLGWSPDGSLFAYSKPAKGRKQSITICSGYVGAAVDNVVVESPIESFAWLERKTMAYANRKGEIRAVAQGAKGAWTDRLICSRGGGAQIADFHGASRTGVTWREGAAVYRAHPGQDEPELIWRGDESSKVSVSFSRERNTFLIATSEKDGCSIRTLYPGPPRLTNLLARIQDRNVSGVKWIHQGRGYAVLCNEPAGQTLILSAEGRESVPLFSNGNVQSIADQGNRLYIVGSTNVEPPGVWEYNCDDGALRCVLKGSDKGGEIYRDFRHEAGVLTNGARLVTYHLWSPRPGLFKRKFPLVIGHTPYTWSPYPYMAVNSGYCFVTVDRPGWFTGLDTWVEDVQAVTARLREHPRVDTAEAYLYGRSAETHYLSELVQQNPRAWKGALLFSPGALPEVSGCDWTKMLVDLGERDAGARERLTQFQRQAARNGVPVRLLVHKTARHTSWSRGTQRTRLEDLGIFLSRQ